MVMRSLSFVMIRPRGGSIIYNSGSAQKDEQKMATEKNKTNQKQKANLSGVLSGYISVIRAEV